ncbi:hypothetical protein J7643_11940 [bacterium]|nr:hypothetical protein [bacterium]
MKPSYLLPAFPLVLGACTVPLHGTAIAEDLAVTLRPVVSAADYQTQTQPDLTPYRAQDIEHLVIGLYTVDGSVETQVVRGGVPVTADVPRASLGGSVTFNNLHSDTTYRFRAFAYKASGTATDDLISQTATGSHVDVSIGRNTRPTLAALPVRLVDRLFSATASGTIVVTPGSVVHEDESMTFVDPTPSPSPSGGEG